MSELSSLDLLCTVQRILFSFFFFHSSFICLFVYLLLTIYNMHFVCVTKISVHEMTNERLRIVVTDSSLEYNMYWQGSEWNCLHMDRAIYFQTDRKLAI